MSAQKPSLFVGSSVEGLPIAHAIQENLDHDAEVTVWPQGVFDLSAGAVDSLLRILEGSDFGVFVFNPDDVLRLRGEDHDVVRDNVIFELGMFIGRLGRQRSFIILPRGQTSLHLPSDLAGLNPADYEPNRSDGNLQAALGAACNQIRRAVQQLGPITAPAGVLEPAEPHKLVLTGIRIGADQIAKAIGPQGRGVAVTLLDGSHLVTKGGSIIARGLRAEGLEKKGLGEVEAIATEMDYWMGDGAKLAVLLFASLAESGLEAVAVGHLPNEVAGGIQRAVEAAKEVILTSAVDTRKKEDVQKVASTAAQSDAVGQMIVDAMEYVGKHGVINIQEAEVPVPELERVEGTRLPFGFVDRGFAGDSPEGRVELSDCYVLVSTQDVLSFRSILQLLEAIAGTNRPLLILAPKIDDEALATLIVNSHKGVVESVAVRIPGSEARRRVELEDLAMLVGAKMVTPDHGLSLEGASISDLGRAKHVVVDEESCTIVGGAGDPDKIIARSDAVAQALDASSADDEGEILSQRLARLTGGVANILVGGLTPSERYETRYQFYSAMHSARKAVEGGILPGGARAFISAEAKLHTILGRTEGEAAGIQAVIQALGEPLRALISNARGSEEETMSRIREDETGHLGFDAENGVVVDLVEGGIVDPALTVAHALETASIHARQLVLTERWVGGDEGSPDTSAEH